MTPSPHLLADIDNVPLRICSRYRRCFLLHSFLLLLFCFFFLLSSCKLHISNKHSNLRTYVQLQLQKLANVCLFLNIFHTHLPSFFLLVLPLSLYLFLKIEFSHQLPLRETLNDVEQWHVGKRQQQQRSGSQGGEDRLSTSTSSKRFFC